MSDDLARKKFTELKERAGQRLVTGPSRVFIPSDVANPSSQATWFANKLFGAI